jgi:lysyl-tRNA synthetase class 1
MQQAQSAHWIDKLVEGILKWQEKNAIAELHVDDMKTPSGRVHVGALRGVILHDLVAKALAAKTGKPIVSTYVFNDMDNMDSLPGYLPAEYANHMGRSLHKIPAPALNHSGINFSGVSTEERNRYENAKTMGEFYAYDFIDAFRILGCSQEIVWSHAVYESGKMDPMIKEALDSIAELRKIYQDVADYQLPEKWYPFQVICESCGLTGSTLVTDWDGEQVTYQCLEKKVEWATGCGHSGKVSPFGGSGKLLWKVDWPAHWKALGINVEGAGKDHTSAGGSRDMAKAICERVYHIHNPFDIPYEWILVRGAKMSSSKGIGTSAREFVNAMPPSVGRFLFAERHYNQVIDFDPATMAIPDLFDEYDMGARIFWKQEEGDLRLGRSFELAQVDGKTPEPHFLPRFRDVANWMQHPEIELETYFAEIKGSPLTEFERLVLDERKKYARFWVENYAPEEFQLTPRATLPEKAHTLTSDQRSFLKQLNDLINSQPNWQALDLQQQLFELAKSSIGSKPAFQAIYLAFLGKTAGPKAAWFLLSINPELRNQRVTELTAVTTTSETHRFPDFNDVSQLSISAEVAAKYPSIILGFAIIRGVKIQRSLPALETAKAEVLASLQGLNNETISAFSEVQSYRKLYKETGIDWHSRRPSPEALLRRLSQGKDLYTVNTCVDAYNLAVLKNRVSVGAFNLSQVQFPTQLQLAQGGEQILLLGDSEPTTLKAGEVSYFDQQGPYNLDFNYRDAQRTMVTEDTVDLMINVDGVHDITRAQVEQTLQDSIDLITKYCGGTVEKAGVITAQQK